MTPIEQKRKELEDMDIVDTVEKYDLDFVTKNFLVMDILNLINKRVEMAQKDHMEMLIYLRHHYSLPKEVEDYMDEKIIELNQSLSNSPQELAKKEVVVSESEPIAQSPQTADTYSQDGSTRKDEHYNNSGVISPDSRKGTKDNLPETRIEGEDTRPDFDKNGYSYPFEDKSIGLHDGVHRPKYKKEAKA